MVVERRKHKKARKDDGLEIPSGTNKPSKDEYAVAKWIRNNVPSKKTKFDRNHIVEYFTGSRAVDALLDKSPWNKTIFETRQQVVDFLEIMLRHKFFHRAKKIVISEDELIRIKGGKKKIKDTKDYKEDKNKSEDKAKDKEKGKDKDETQDAREGDEDDKNKDENEKKDKTKENKKKPKVRLEMHMEQYFVDCNDAYVWIYEPIPVYYWFFGTLLVLGAIGVCLFPLWPLTVRHGVWYLSIAAAGFLVFMISLIIIRLIIFCILWLLTLGRHHLWLFPNLIEDVGFFASFWPLYHYEYFGPNSSEKKSLKKKKRKKDKDSDAEDAGNSYSDKEKSESSSEASKVDSPQLRKTVIKNDQQVSEGNEASEEGSESEKSNTGADFEML